MRQRLTFPVDCAILHPQDELEGVLSAGCRTPIQDLADLHKPKTASAQCMIEGKDICIACHTHGASLVCGGPQCC